MGFDIDINSYAISNGQARKRSTINSTYLSYNWGDLSDICLQHCLIEEGKCPEDNDCQKIHLWYFKDDCHGRRGDDVEERSKKALLQLKKMGVEIGQPDIGNSNWGWGVGRPRGGGEFDNEKMAPRQRLGVFAYHLDRFRQLGQQYPKYFFVGDCWEAVTLPDGTSLTIINNDESDDDADDQK